MFGFGKKKAVMPEDYETRPVKMVKISDNSWQFVWADEKQ
jgi:hypothetical protein